MPSWELFEAQSDEYKNSVLPKNVKARVAVEAACEMGWSKYIGDNGIFVGTKGFGISAPYKVCYEKFGITAAGIVDAAKKSIKK
jgi:transketolase